MPRKSAAQKAAEDAAAAAAERQQVEQQRLKWAAVFVLAVAIFTGGYAVGQSAAESQQEAFIPFGGDEFPPFLEGTDFDGEFPPFLIDEGFEFDGDFEFRFDPDGFDRRDRPERGDRRQLDCNILDRDEGGLTLSCVFPDFFPRDGDFDDDFDERPRDQPPGDEPGFLGVGLAETPFGVTVLEMLDDSPAAEAGIELDDVILEFDGIGIESAGHLADLVAAAGVGAEVEITVLRFDSEVTVLVVLGERPE